LAGRTPTERTARAWRRPVARIADGLTMCGVATAAVDVSDGLVRDLGHLARASGVAAVLDRSAVQNFVSKEDQMTLMHVLCGGEDYALVCTSPTPITGFVHIGTIVSGTGVRLDDGTPLDDGGFDHFRTAE
jgi:thiamine-monophosphate kinase